MIKNIISRITMVKTGRSFYDAIEKRNVYYWQDYYFNVYLSYSRWGRRVKL